MDGQNAFRGPEPRGAFLYGEGQHGYTKPDGHYMDDLWFYDVDAHRWICCYPCAPTKTLRLQLNADGFEATLDGDLVPVAQQVHGDQMNTYDTDAKRMLSMPNTHSYWQRAIPQRREWLEPPPADASPWFFEPATGKWRPESHRYECAVRSATETRFFTSPAANRPFSCIATRRCRSMTPQQTSGEM